MTNEPAGPLQNVRHEAFCQHRAKGKSRLGAYRLVYGNGNKSSASKLGARPDVQARIAYLLQTKVNIEQQSTQKAVEATGITKAAVLNELWDNAMKAKQAEPVKDADGKATGEYTANLAASNRALELCGKELGMFIDRKEVGEPGDFDKLDDDELERALAEADRVIAAARGAARDDHKAKAAAGKAKARGKT